MHYLIRRLPGPSVNRTPRSTLETCNRAHRSFAHAHAILGRLLIHSGRCDEGIQQVEQAIRLSPFVPSAPQYLNILSLGHLYLGNYVMAVELAPRAPRRRHVCNRLKAELVPLATIIRRMRSLL
jgi:hypothetical protein